MRIGWLILIALVGWGQSVVVPESVGMDSAVLKKLDADLAGGMYGNVDSLLVLRHGKVVFDKGYARDYDAIYGKQAKVKGAMNAHEDAGQYNYFNPWWHPYYRRGDLHSLQSVTKTVTSMVIGVAVTRGEFPSLDTPVMRFFDAAKVKNVDARKQRMTIRHLLTMSAGLDWNQDLESDDPLNNESVMEASADWVQYAIDRPMSEEPGTRFNYNSGASELLAHVFQQAMGQDLEEYAVKHLFAPLKITRFYWKRIPWGLVDTEGGLYLERHDVAKLMMLFAAKGVWEGKRVVSEEWVKDSIAPRMVADPKTGVKYGYKWWLYPYGKGNEKVAFGGSGFGGQFPMVLPDYGIVIVVNGWNVLPGGTRMSHRAAIDRVLEAVKEK